MLVALAFVVAAMVALPRLGGGPAGRRPAGRPAAGPLTSTPADAVALAGDEAPALVVRVAPGGRYFVGPDEQSLEQLDAALAAAKAGPRRAVMVRAPAATPLEDLAGVMRLCIRHDLKVILDTEARP
jgi:biopolymer transport protein ExbD